VQAPGTGVVGRDDAGLEDVAVEMEVHGSVSHRFPESRGDLVTDGDQLDGACVDELLLEGVEVAGSAEHDVAGGQGSAQAWVPQAGGAGQVEPAEVPGGGVGGVQLQPSPSRSRIGVAAATKE